MQWQRVYKLIIHAQHEQLYDGMRILNYYVFLSLLFNWVYKVQVLICRNAIVSIGKVLGVKGTYANTVLTIA